MKKIVKFPVEITDEKHIGYLHNEYKEVHEEMLKGASVECYYKGLKVILEKKNRDNLDSMFATRTTIKRNKIEVLEDKPTAYMFQKYTGAIIPLWKVKEN